MILLRLISWPYFRKHVLRTALTTAGIVLGVAVFVGMHTANSSVLLAFSRTVDRIAGKTELQVTAGEAGFHEEVLEKVQAASTVRVAVPVIEAVVDTNLKGQGNLLVLGVDMTGDRSLRDYDLDRRRCGHRRSAGVSRAAGLDHPVQGVRREESDRRRQPHRARNGGRPQAVHGARRDEVLGPHERVRRQPRRDGHLRGPAHVRPRPLVRSHRPRGEGRTHAQGGGAGADAACSAPASRWTRRRGAGSSSKRCSPPIR